ncbi:MAG TPA: hypothetical protein VGD80_28990, partial [Kofleriaceae bacterium]
ARARSAATVADMDASAERREVAVGFVDRLVVWNYRDATVKVAGSSLAVYNVEVAGARIVAASSPGSVQLWDLSGAPAIPVEPRSLGAWLGAQVSRYRFEQEDR